MKKLFIPFILTLSCLSLHISAQQNPTQVKEIRPGALSSLGSFTNLIDVNGTLFFSANDGTNGYELWKSDGTNAGTVLIKDINTGTGHGVDNFNDFTNVNGILFFAGNSNLGREPWVSDGTNTGTFMLNHIRPGSFSSMGVYTSFQDLNGTLLFSARNDINGVELWKSDGTTAGTVLVKDIKPGTGDGIDEWNNLTNVNGTLFFAALGNTSGRELWKSDGTAAGTVMVKDIYPGTGGSVGTVTRFANVNGTLFFFGRSVSHGYELWKSDGTDAGTVLVKDINTGTASSITSYSSSFAAIGNTLYFTANNGSNGNELWKSDGTDAGTVMVKDIYSGGLNGMSTENHFTNINGTLFFRTNNGINGNELWKSDGTNAGTVMVKDINPGSASSSISSIISYNNQAFFTATDNTGDGLFVSDGTSAGTQKLFGDADDIMNIEHLTISNNKLFFAAETTISGKELWVYDPATGVVLSAKELQNSNTLPIANIYPNPNQGNFNIDLTDDEETTIEIYSTGGLLIKSQLLAGSQNHNIQLDHIAAGLYILHLRTANKKQVSKIIID